MSDKPQLNRDSTMAATTKAGKEFIGNEKLGDTRHNTQAKKAMRKTALRKGHTIKKTIEEARQLLGKSSNLADVNSARQLRKRPAPARAVASHTKRVNKKGAGRPPKKAKTNNNSSDSEDASVGTSSPPDVTTTSA